ncbi:4'-phosphopantetheinyl transferase family protein [Streptomyces sp. URMC 123]|uniref:4'-phosphopantetheinyl transferase family protein n=1 Tax=Streptomyces sp. URMC 123 TaxID=3423403 RepID=UPI003F1D3BC7
MNDPVAALFAPVPVVVGRARVGERRHDELPRAARLDPPPRARRAAEYTAGRLAAHRALRALTGRALWPGRTASGAPSWPPGVRGSLSHSDTLALCVVTAADLRVGVDLEPLSSAGALHRGRHLVARPAERPLLAAAPDAATAVLRLFSAKEASYKALPAGLRSAPTFLALELRWDPTATDPVRLRPIAGRAADLRVVSAVRGGHVVSAATYPARPR